MRPVTWGMLLLAAVLTAPALAEAARGEMPLDVALVRYLLVAGGSWVMLSIASEWLWTPSSPSAPAVPAPESATESATDAPGETPPGAAAATAAAAAAAAAVPGQPGGSGASPTSAA